MSRGDRGRAKAEGTSRRQVLTGAAGAAVLGVSALNGAGEAAEPGDQGPAVKNGRIKQSVVPWCFEKHWDVPRAIQVAKQLGCPSVELIHPRYFPLLREHGLCCAIAPIDMSPDLPFVKGYNNPRHHARIIKATRDSINACAEYGYERVIAFTGLREGIPDDVGADHCVAGLKKVVGHAEKKKVTICVEILNSRVDAPMMGHPGYQGDHTDYLVEIIKRVGSPNMKLLFDIYHVQVMDGDIIRRIRQLRDVIGHVHTAGNPGRGELDDKQEISYAPIMKALVEIGYNGYVGQEFIPTRDPLAGLREAVTLCDV
jgi:hydroxypyruvate isomerase